MELNTKYDPNFVTAILLTLPVWVDKGEGDYWQFTEW